MNEKGWPRFPIKSVAGWAFCEEGYTLAFLEAHNGAREVWARSGGRINPGEARLIAPFLAAAVVSKDAARPGEIKVPPGFIKVEGHFIWKCGESTVGIHKDTGRWVGPLYGEVRAERLRDLADWQKEVGEYASGAAPAPKPPMPEAVKALAEAADDVAETLHKCGFQCTARGLCDLARAAEAEYQSRDK